MTPAGGIGAVRFPCPSGIIRPNVMQNTAVRDSALLGKLLGEAGGWKEGVTDAYEKTMRVYGSEAVKASYGMATTQLGIKIDEGSSPTVG
jgi:hypothetical protein